MSGGIVRDQQKTKKDEMRVVVGKHEHAYGEGGPEKQSGKEGPDRDPSKKGG